MPYVQFRCCPKNNIVNESGAMLQLFNRRPRPLRSSNGILPTKQPTSKGDSWQNSKGHPSFPRRYGRITALITSLAFLGVLGWLLCTYEFEEADIVEIDPHPELPPSYSSYHERERRLPQHSLSLPPPEGRHAKFFWARNHVHGTSYIPHMQDAAEPLYSVWLGQCDAGAYT